MPTKDVIFRELKETGIISSIAFLTMDILPILGLFAFAAIENRDYLDKSSFYFASGIAGLFILAFGLNIISIFFPKSPVRAILHDPEIGFMPKFLQKYMTMYNVFSVSLLIFLLVALFSVQTNTFFIATPGIQAQQITETGTIILETEPASTSETMLAVAVLSITWTLLNVIVWKLGGNELTSKTLALIILPIEGLIFWVSIHYARYGGSDVAILAVMFFGFMGTLLTILTGSIIPWWVWHFINNLYFSLFKIVGKDAIVIGTIIAIVSYIIIFSLSKISVKQEVSPI